MSDPAVLAVNRALGRINYKMSNYQRFMIVAREALGPIREIVADMRNLGDHGAFIESYPYKLTEELEKLCFTTEEIENA